MLCGVVIYFEFGNLFIWTFYKAFVLFYSTNLPFCFLFV